MPYSVIVTVDGVAGAAIETMWDILANKGIGSEGQVQGNHPHITLGVYHSATKCEAARKAVSYLAASREAPDVTLSGYGIFPGERCALWAVPIVTRKLLALHEELYAQVASDDPHYAPDRWIPHLTLVRNVGAATAVAGLNLLVPSWHGTRGVLAQIELISFVPVVVLETCSFAPSR